MTADGSRIGRRGLATAALLLAAAAVAPAAASATFPGSNGVVAFVVSTATRGDIFTINPDGSDTQAITNTTDDDSEPSFSADGERIVFARRPDGAGTFNEIWIMNADGSGQTRLISGTSATTIADPSFSPDGSTIVYTARDAATTTDNIWAMGADGSNPHALTHVTSPEDVFGPAFSPDGSKIAAAYKSAGFVRIALMNPDGSGLSGVSPPSPGAAGEPDWSPDGSRITYRNGQSIYEMDPDGLNSIALTTSSGPPYDSAPVFSPQGPQFAFNRQGATSTGEVRLGTAGSSLGPTSSLVQTSGGASAGSSLSWQAINPPSCSVGGTDAAKSGKSVSVTVSCANENASVTIDGTGKAPKGKKGGKGKRKSAKFTIPPVTSEIPAGGSTEVKVKLPKKPAKAVKKGKKVKATLDVTFTDGLGSTTDDSSKVAFKKKGKK